MGFIYRKMGMGRTSRTPELFIRADFFEVSDYCIIQLGLVAGLDDDGV